MILRLVLVILLLLASPVSILASPNDRATDAVRDLLKIPTSDRQYIRYLTCWYVPPVDRQEFYFLMATHLNKLSRKGTLRLPVLLRDDLFRIDMRWYGWDHAVWERLTANPHFHESLVDQNDKDKKEVRALAAWVDSTLHGALVQLTKSKVPIVAAPWFLIQTGAAKDRVAGYYDWLGIKDRKSYFQLIGLDEKVSIARQREFAAIVRRSGIAQRPRQVFRHGANDFGAWRTLDVIKASTRKRNAVDRLDQDYQHDVEEHFGFLPNGLFCYLLCDQKGIRADTAPDEVGPDTSSTSVRTVVEPMISCVRCHTEGLRPIDDFARRQFALLRLDINAKDYKKVERIQQLYLRDYEHWLTRDNRDYQYALAQIGGPAWTPQRVSLAYKRFWKTYADDDLTPRTAAAELGTSAEHLLVSMRRWTKPVAQGGLGQRLPNSWGAFLQVPPSGLVRDHFEEHYALGQLVIRGVLPLVKVKP